MKTNTLFDEKNKNKTMALHFDDLDNVSGGHMMIRMYDCAGRIMTSQYYCSACGSDDLAWEYPDAVREVENSDSTTDGTGRFYFKGIRCIEIVANTANKHALVCNSCGHTGTLGEMNEVRLKNTPSSEWTPEWYRKLYGNR